MGTIDKINKMLNEAPSRQAMLNMRIDALVNEVIKKYKGKGKVIDYDDLLRMAAERRLYKDDLPDIQAQLEDEGFTFDI